jgi:hypothetical protein
MGRLVLQVILVAVIALGFVPSGHPIEVNGPKGVVVVK